MKQATTVSFQVCTSTVLVVIYCTLEVALFICGLTTMSAAQRKVEWLRNNEVERVCK